MKRISSLLFALLVAFSAYSQTTPTSKTRSNDAFTQVDNYLTALKRLGIPTATSDVLEGTSTAQNSAKIIWRSDLNKLRVYNPVDQTWRDALEADLSNYYTKAEVDDLIANIPTLSFENGIYEEGGVVKLGVNPDYTKGLLNERLEFVRLHGTTGFNSMFVDNLRTGIGYSSGFSSGVSSFMEATSSGAITQYRRGHLDSVVTFLIGQTGSLSGATFEDKWRKMGISYIDDYSNNGKLSPRWIPDIGAVRGEISDSLANIPTETPTLQQVLVQGNSAGNKITNLTAPTVDLDAANKEYVDAQSVIESLDEGNGIGYRVRGRNPDNYGNIGANAVDFSNSVTASEVRGATGSASFASGVNVTAGGAYSFASGTNAIANGAYSFASGSLVSSTGNAAVAIGQSLNANGNGSVAMGANNSAPANYSVSLGRYSEVNTPYTTMLGRYGHPLSTLTSVDEDTQPLLILGNGMASNSRKNAYVMFKNGRSEQEKDVEVTETGQGFVLKSPNGTRYRITVANGGALSATPL